MVDIKFDYRFASEEFFTEEVKTVLEAAGKIWSDLLEDDFENIPAGAQFTVQNPVTGAAENITLNEAIDDLLIFVGASENPFGGAGNNTRGFDSGDTHLKGCCCNYCHSHPENNADLSETGILNSSADVGLLAQAKVDGTDLQGDRFQRRIASDFRGTGAVTDFEPWAGVISFSTNLPGNTEWDFSLGNPDPDKFDFITVALHEIGHVLGFGVAPAFTNLADNNLFNGFNAKNVNNGQTLPLTSDLGHLEEGFANDTTLLDSVLGDGRITPTDIDLAILADIGYEIAGFTKQGFVPEIATEGNDTINGSLLDDLIDGLVGNDSIDGNQGNDTVRGGADNDQLFGGSSADYVLGDEGNDEIQGNEGNDTLEGGAGNDTIFGDIVSLDNITESDIADGKENDIIFGDSGDDSLQGGVGDDTIRGNDDNDTLFGEQGNDFLLGNSDEDQLQGGEGNDYLRGGDGNDQLLGENGDDTLEGGKTNDTLVGGTGSDRFDFGFDFGNDIINDYIVSQDSLRFSAKYDFDTKSYDLTDASEIINLISNQGQVANSDQIFTEITVKEDNKVTIFHDTQLTVDEVEIYFPFQTSFTETNSGFELEFNKTLDISNLNLYETNQVPDLSFISNSTGEDIDGSLIWNESDLTLTFVKTDGILEPDTYTLSLFSRDKGFVTTAGELLDGDNDGIEGDNFVLEFEVGSNQKRIVAIDDISRGIGQSIANPKTEEGLIISLDNGAQVTKIDLSLTYDSAVLDLNNIILDPDIPSDWTISSSNINDNSGTAEVSLQGTTALDPGAVDILQLEGIVKTDAEYGDSNLLRLENISLNQGNIEVIADDGLLKVTRPGDADGDNNYSNADAFLISEIAAGIRGNLAGIRENLNIFNATDSRIVSDVNQDGAVSAFDAYIIYQEANGVDTGFLS
ncbi:MAG: hypothetical protein QNJ60_14635 [Xenococcaceae cyanobacterium MO_188.B19]|nr:hypothetical protein [Xenococcaceae cyanobacterium MO_188.B19]